MSEFYLMRYHKINGDLVDETLLEGVSEDDVRRAFGLSENEYPGDCLHISGLQDDFFLKGSLDLGNYDYFVEIRRDENV
jgi:hypothetical protein